MRYWINSCLELDGLVIVIDLFIISSVTLDLSQLPSLRTTVIDWSAVQLYRFITSLVTKHVMIGAAIRINGSEKFDDSLQLSRIAWMYVWPYHFFALSMDSHFTDIEHQMFKFRQPVIIRKSLYFVDVQHSYKNFSISIEWNAFTYGIKATNRLIFWCRWYTKYQNIKLMK